MDAVLGELVNPGARSVGWLHAAGVTDVPALRRPGPVAAFRRVEQAGFTPSVTSRIVRENIRWDRLTHARRSELIRELDAARDLERQLD